MFRTISDIKDKLYRKLGVWPPPALSGMQLGPDGSAQNPMMLQFFTWESKHENMSWWKHFEQEIPRLAELGFTQIWLPPPNKAMKKGGQGYDAYDLWDIGEFDQKDTIATRWGTKDELLQACAVARQHGIGVVIDAVLNHKLGADRCEAFSAVPVDPTNRLKDLGKERQIQGWTVFDFPGRKGKHSSFVWTQEHFTGLDWDHQSRTNGVFRITGNGHRGWSKWVDKELGNYDYLLGVDIDHRHPRVRQDLFSWGSWILDTTGGSGFRLDAIKHMDRRFLLEFIKRSREHPDRRRLFSVAEYWSANLQLILPYVQAFQGQTAFFDVPLHENFFRASKAGSGYDLRTIFDNTLVNVRPGDAVTFVDNHELQVGQSLESWVDTNFKLQAYALILLRKDGYPCVFYGDLYPNQECYNETVSRQLQQLLIARKIFAYGPTRDYVENSNCIGFVRAGNSLYPGCAVVVSNATRSSLENLVQYIRMNVGLEHGGATYFSYLETGSQKQEVEIDVDGWGLFPCFMNEVQIFIKDVGVVVEVN
ncbi:glycoside hydrolase family 13 protein [Serpula lacrymans var. lacrymans S7.3]|uniref:Glycoside hydrolase family 13 protein n=2 Tax=Serpula lacrymans var. lacrymans TaxID=341189 RepID=F8PWT3_SERL3|nr:glycoside hydrolase family 13 protein [Serpula lacrymans var. lacrymans S7.9]EGN99260.1 glycoside hydrolase family 13 protein [Serpula lacrymans var. lacrymans S7.3]EGO24825.1 glycoside hydrolase family 13 protein [Serpula lacrymans var. lacrymans S7.9]